MAAVKKEAKGAAENPAQALPGQESPPEIGEGDASQTQENPAKGSAESSAAAPEAPPLLTPPPKKEKAFKKEKPFVVCAGKAVTSQRGILSAGEFVKEADFKGVTLKELAKRGVIEPA